MARTMIQNHDKERGVLKSITIIHHGQKQSRCAVSELYEQAHVIHKLYHTAIQVSEKIEKKKSFNMQSLNLLTALQYFMGKDWLVPAALSRVQGQLETAKISPKELRPSNKHTSDAIITLDLPAYEFSARNSDLPAIYFAQDSVLFCKKTKPGRFFKTVQNTFSMV